jgi:hypothetical protein
VTEQFEGAVRDELRRRLVTREQQQDGSRDDLVLSQRLAIGLGLQQIRNQIVLRVRLAPLDDPLQVVGELLDALLGPLVAVLGVVVVKPR